ncbi:molybdopterin converting factor small subunit [Thermosipho japonicus]|uniref:Molybdopterin converting factor small subunit n=1 Tax=Thermosipho japonicus TaxID=90323 RepID=A0A841GI29_9BACT|nr:MoaD/ThiS family protein [Thermosipho japonicus]MBB6062027.1 molybdopterin converting factor small subunit [Thermosipho japonicus]
MLVKFVGSIKYLLGKSNIEVCFKDENDLLEQISKKLNKEILIKIDKENKKTFLIINDEQKIKLSVVILNNGENILRKNKIEDGELAIILPVGGG